MKIINGIDSDFTASGAERWYQKTEENEDGWMGLLERNVTKYSPEDLYPTARDPACKPVLLGPDWPLARYWPVFLGNFFVHEWNEESWYYQISEYFAHKGLLTRMVYFNSQDLEYWEINRKCSLIEGLVYFCSERDAKRAVSECHRERYYGHILNVLPGRILEYMDPARSILFKSYEKETSRLTSTELENMLNPFGKVDFSSRHQDNHIYIQFASKEDMLDAVASQDSWKPIVLCEKIRKQRIIEEDVKLGIQQILQNNRGFLEWKPRPSVLKYFFDGFIPIVETTWKGFRKPEKKRNQGPPYNVNVGYTGGPSKKTDEQRLAKREQRKVNKLMWKIESKKQRKDARLSINYLMNTHGRDRVTSKTMRVKNKEAGRVKIYKKKYQKYRKYK